MVQILAIGNRLTPAEITSPDRVRYFGDPTSAFDYQAKAVLPSFKQIWENRAHSYKGFFIKDAVPLHDTPKNYLTQSPDASTAEVYNNTMENSITTKSC